MYMYVAYIQIFSVLQKGGGRGVGLHCTVCTCMHMENFLPLYSRDLDTPDRYQNIPIYLWLIQCTLSHNSWTDRQYFKQGTEKHRQSTLWWFWYWFCKKKKSNRVVHVFLLEDGSVAVKILVYTRFQYVKVKTMFLVMSFIYYKPMCKSNKVHVNEDTAEECKYYTWITNSECV